MRALMLAALLAASPAVPAPEAPPAIDYAAERAAIGRYQDANQRLQDAGWRLARANAAFCPVVIPSIGLQVQDMASYGGPDVARAALGLAGDFAVNAAAAGSPAALSGAFARNREIVRLEGFDPNEWPATPPMAWERTTRAHDHIDATLAEHGGITIAFADGTEARVTPVAVCATRFDLYAAEHRAFANGTRVIFGMGSPAFGYEEPVFAALVAHELAHNVLGHDAWLDRNGRSAKNVRRIEREADRLVPWLLANAGHDPAAGADFMTRWGKKYDAGLKLRVTHDGWDERAENMEAEVPLVRTALAAEGRADWAKHFRREIDPAGGVLPRAKR
ncbi:MAG: hypothetical protein NBV68_11645 [Erythrobacter sp.]|uniref:hypothetical protein n=1 Tax=Erythrobacter sp. TaxID=1042 RepID=UPI0025F03EE2|nr:hypothetical protein [Erythrobacter sp.]MCM0000028.1 hypothetical protein [Erythrobacter sp.]